MTRAARNLFGGFSASAVSAIAGLAILPLYLAMLGPEGYGLVGLFLALQGMLQVFDLGLTAAASRIVARARSHPGLADNLHVLTTLSRIAWCVAAVLAILLLGVSGAAAAHWLRLEQLQVADAASCLALMAVALGLRWPAGFYQSVLLGADRMDRSSLVTICVTLATHVGGLGALWASGGNLQALFAWQVGVSALHVGWMRAEARRAAPVATPASAGRPELRSLQTFSSALIGVSALGLVLANADKLLLSRMLPLAGFGEYMACSLLAGGLYAVVVPVFNWAYPRLAALAGGAPERLEAEYRGISHALACLLLPGAAVMAAAAQPLLALWTGNQAFAARNAPVLALLCLGNAMHGVMFIPYALGLAKGETRLILRINVVLVVVGVPLIGLLARAYGATGAAGAWLLLHAGYLTFGSAWTHRTLLGHLAGTWLRRDIGLPLLAGAVAGGLGRMVLSADGATAQPRAMLAAAALLLVILWFGLAATSSRIRDLLRPFCVRLRRG